MLKFRKKPVVVEAMNWNGPNADEVIKWSGARLLQQGLAKPRMLLVIETLEGNMEASIGDWIIKGLNGEFYPCKPDIFTKSYEAV